MPWPKTNHRLDNNTTQSIQYFVFHHGKVKLCVRLRNWCYIETNPNFSCCIQRTKVVLTYIFFGPLNSDISGLNSDISNWCCSVTFCFVSSHPWASHGWCSFSLLLTLYLHIHSGINQHDTQYWSWVVSSTISSRYSPFEHLVGPVINFIETYVSNI